MRKFTAISLALLMLALSLRVGIAYHFCGGKFVQFRIVVGNGKASCGMESEESNCKNNLPISINKIPCCKDQLQQITTDDYQPTNQTVQTLVEFSIPPSQIINTSSEQGFEFRNFGSYRPPPDLASVSLLFIQVFRI